MKTKQIFLPGNKTLMQIKNYFRINIFEQTDFNLDQSRGFTIIELLVVVSIIGLLASTVIADYAGQRIPRSLTIAQNELVTNLRALQSYTLSSRTDSGTLVEFYVVRLDLANPTSYLLQSISKSDTPTPQVHTVQTINFPTNIQLRALSINGVTVNGCGLLAFKLPYAKVIMRGGCSLPSSPTVTTGDDYNTLVTFVNNGLAVSDQPMVITLSDRNNTRTKTVTISGVTGLINFQ